MWLLPCVYACIACCTSRKQVIEVKICGDAKDVHKSCANNERDDEAQASSDVPRSPPRPERSEPATSSAAVPVNSQNACAGIPATRPASDVHVPKAARPPRHYRERNDILEPVIVTGNRGYAYHSRYTCPNLRTAKHTHTQCLRPMPFEKVTRLARSVCTEVYGSLG